MRTISTLGEAAAMNACVATVGFFDGVHSGHRFLINHVREEACQRGLEATVVTFDKHPREVLHSDFQPKMLSTLGEKLALIGRTGVDNCVVLPFSEELAKLSALDFMRDILRDRLKVKAMVAGYDNRIGHNRSEGFDDYVRHGRELGLDVVRSQAYVVGGVNVSSSVIRSFLQEGEVEMAGRCLGYPYTIVGEVVHGDHLGTELGFPTANLRPTDGHKMVPAPGVYAVKASLIGGDKLLSAMMNIGSRPTFSGKQTTLEVYILNFNGDIYGQRLAVHFIHRLRAERKFRNSAELVGQLRRDLKTTEEQFEKERKIFDDLKK